jgi:large subunit ribosomal protein L20
MTPWDRKKYYKLAKGFYGRNKNCRRTMVPRVEKSLVYAYRDRRVRRRLVRTEWILSINAAFREHFLNYSNFIFGLNRSNMKLDRKILADLAKNEPYSFKAVVDEVKLTPRIKELARDDVSYNEAMKRGLIIEGQIIVPVSRPFVSKIFSDRTPNKLTNEQVQQLKSM